jgi:hypothetical protein
MSRSTWPRLLIVEGQDDLHVVGHLAKTEDLLFFNGRKPPANMEEARAIEIIDEGTVQNVLNSMTAYLTDRTGLRRFGVVMDADDSVSDRWKSVKDRFSKKGIALPSEIDPDGFVGQSPNGVRIGVWLMPDNLATGMLENFAAQMIPDDDRLWGLAKRSVQDASTAESRAGRRFKDIHLAKAEIHTWLAWQDEPGQKLGQAIDQRMLSIGSPVALSFVNWLRRLYLD